VKKKRVKQRAKTRPAGPKDAWAAAAAYGFDMKLLEERLRMTPAERIEANQRALDLIEQFQIAARGVLERARQLRLGSRVD
jgi:hypothetical protein